MNNRRQLLVVAAFAATLTPAPPAAAHTGTEHGKKPASAKKEQKPWGIAGDVRAAKRTVAVKMLDTMRFVPDLIAARHGETLRIRVHNAGAQLHEFVIGTRAENEAHAELMKKFPNMEHDEPWMAHVPAGKTGEIVWRFNRAGEFEFACLIAGHYSAGMTGRVQVGPA